MNLLFDTNVVLDVIQERKPYLRNSSWVFTRIERDIDRGILGGTTLTTIYYIISKDPGLTEKQVRAALRRLLRTFEVAAVGRSVLEDALDLAFEDYEDAVLHEAGRRAGVDAIVTRNAKDFAESTLPVYTPTELRLTLEAQ